MSVRLVARGLGRSIGERTLFRDLDLEVGPGEVVAVRGPSGSGKSQLLRTLAWLVPAEAGELSLDGRTPDAWGPTRWRAEVTYVAQRPPVLLGSPAEHLEAIARLRIQRTRAADDAVALAERWGLPASAWARPWRELSGGEAQRAALAVAVSRRPAVLLLDEPTSALDPTALAAVEADLAGRAAVWVTHDRDQAARVAVRTLELG